MHRREFLCSGLTVAALATYNNTVEALNERSDSSPIIDVHCHAGRGMNYDQKDPSSPPWTTYNDPQWVMEQAREAGIDLSVIFPISNLHYKEANEEIAGYVRKHPDRLIGFAKHDPKTEEDSIRELLVHEVHDLGLKGLKLHAVPTLEILEVVSELRIPILMHPPRVADCLAVVRDHPQINFILAHLGSFASRDWREHLQAIEAAKRYSNLHLDTSGVVFFLYLQQATRQLPAEQLLFGSDAPLVDARVELHKIRLLKLPDEKQQKILGGNARRLLGLDGNADPRRLGRRRRSETETPV